jgi:hypothetical protein
VNQGALLRAADLLMLWELREECAVFLAKSINNGNVLELLEIGDQLDLNTLRNNSVDHLCDAMQVVDDLHREFV